MNNRDVFASLSEIYPISRACFERLELFVARLREWQQKTNLVAPSTLDDIWGRHVADSLQCFALKPDARRWLDLGSGGGFPGLVLAAVLADEAGAQVVLVESIQKKTSFLRQVARQMQSGARIVTSRIEDFDDGQLDPEIVTARALTAMPRLLELAHPWLSAGATGLFHKGREFNAELADCNGLWEFDLVHHDSRISPGSVIVEVSNLKRKTG